MLRIFSILKEFHNINTENALHFVVINKNGVLNNLLKIIEKVLKDIF